MSDKVLEVKLDHAYTGAGTTSLVRWFHFEKMLRNEGKLHPNEIIEGVKVSSEGIQYYIGTR
jgi:hypothetical protein